METIYLVDFENVNNNGIENLKSLPKGCWVHIFSTKNALNIRMDLALVPGLNVIPHVVPAKKESLDMHLVSYLGFLVGKHGDKYSYAVVSKDKDYDNIIQFWKNEGIANISRIAEIPKSSKSDKASAKAKNERQTAVTTTGSLSFSLSGAAKTEFNAYLQHGLRDRDYSAADTAAICKIVCAHCNEENMLVLVHNELRSAFGNDYIEIYSDVKEILEQYPAAKKKKPAAAANKKPDKHEAQVRCFFGQHFKKQIYKDNKESVIELILKAKTRQQLNNGLMRLFGDGKVVKHILDTIQPLIADLPGQ